jgi:hypothetical protein
MQEHGIWSGAAGGFIASQLTEAEAPSELARLVAGGEDADDLEILRACPQPGHDEQPEDGCEDCAEDDDCKTEEA